MALAGMLGTGIPAMAHETGACGDDLEADRPEARALAARRVEWTEKGANPRSWREVKVLGFNDFHGQLSPRTVGTRPAGGAAVLASYLKAAQAGMEDRTVIVHAGDHVGASPPASALLQDEPAISFLNLLGNAHCSSWWRMNPRCNLVGTLGNHEFDEGRAELLRLLYGGAHPEGPFLEDPYRGTTFPYVSANVVDARRGEPLLPPYVVKMLRGIPVGFVGAVTRTTPRIVTPAGVAGLAFEDEAVAINRAVAKLKRQGVRAIVVTIHEGDRMTTYEGPTNPDLPGPGGSIADIVERLDDEVDVVVSGHAHSFTNALVKTSTGKTVLVTQAFSSSTAYADISLKLDPFTRDVVAKSAAVYTTWADAGPGLTPDPKVAALVKRAEDAVAPLVNRVLGTSAQDITRTVSPAGESALGNLIADAQRAKMGTDFAFMNPGGIRADLDAGAITWGELFTIQPFANDLVRMDLTGAQVKTVLEQQWSDPARPRILQVSGLTVRYDSSLPSGSRIVSVRKGGVELDPAGLYSVTVNSFLAGGGDGFVELLNGANRVVGPVDLDGLVEYVLGFEGEPVSTTIEGRISQVN
ncbi:bifunctional metallophosphatase/5'-nucleotidase [Pyxidicoccus fallax]|nr:bifunctional metallophosphatase/5'-nucleotidase [Pyxidicoccus fallax]